MANSIFSADAGITVYRCITMSHAVEKEQCYGSFSTTALLH